MFYDHPAELIVERCFVALSTAFAYKSGHVKSCKRAAKPLRLHRDRVVLIPGGVAIDETGMRAPGAQVEGQSR